MNRLGFKDKGLGIQDLVRSAEIWAFTCCGRWGAELRTWDLDVGMIPVTAAI